ncbi:hypothetical protein [Sphingobium sp. CCH11-B1]|uniref:hypothetical protein n=1 Tax=Sphingobium sp. CCH11-B1 TaxID=1768781 RepID=UPI001E30B3A2|nr:hypothetical protein [Sphingobium sp. CCH11-B1]
MMHEPFLRPYNEGLAAWLALLYICYQEVVLCCFERHMIWKIRKDFVVESSASNKLSSDRPRFSLSAWLWRPWYAKVWWTAIPVWWLGMATSTHVDFLESFYRGGIAGYLNILFFPMTALMVLGIGYVRDRLDNFVGEGDGIPLSDAEEADALRKRIWEDHDRAMKNLRAGTDVFDPRSGLLWIGNPMNPNNPGYIDPSTGKHL